MDERDDIMMPFQMLRVFLLHHENGARMRISQHVDRRHPMTRAHALAIDALLPHLEQFAEVGWTVSRSCGAAVIPCGEEPPNQTPESYHLRQEAILATLRTAGVEGFWHAKGMPAGWLRVLECVSDGIAARMSLPDAGRVQLQQVKEKFGTLRVYARVEGPNEFIADIRQIIDWAEAETETRCAVTGKPAQASNNGWLLYLSPEMATLRAADPKAFGALIYPDELSSVPEP